MLNDITINFYSKDNLVMRKKYGQYMTPFNIIKKSLDDEEIKLYNNILEPSIGTGQFIDYIIKLNKKANITGIELDNELFTDVTKSYSKYIKKNQIKLINQDFLKHQFVSENLFDLIIGNPPYFEMNLTNEQKKDYNEIISGRVNIYSLFIFKCINLLKEKGRLIFVIPTSLLSSKYFEKLRWYIYKTCNIVDIITLNSNDFTDALQSTMIFKLDKLEQNKISNNKFIVNIGSTIIFSEKYNLIDDLISNKKFIQDLNCKVKTGNIIWNQYKQKLSNVKTNNNVMLVYPRNLIKDKIEEITHDTKKQYIQIDKNPIFGPLIVINRIIGIKSISLKPVLVESNNVPYYFENHINIITGDLANLKIIFNSLKKSETNNFIKNIIGNTQLSKTELETMIPIF